MAISSSGLEAFYVCAIEQNFTKASEKLHLTQSALSQRIKNLEEELGTTLFLRERIGVKLTEEGYELLRYCQQKNQIEQEVLSKLKKSQSEQLTGLVKIGGFSSIVRSAVLPSLNNFMKRNPDVQFHIMNKELYELPDLLKSGALDMIILDSYWDRAGIKSILLGHESNVRIRKKGTKPKDIFLDHDENDETTLKFLKLKAGTNIKRHYFDDIYAIIDGVRAGIAEAVVSQHLIADLNDVEVVENRVVKTPIVLHFYEKPYYSQLHQNIVNELIKGLSHFCENDR